MVGYCPMFWACLGGFTLRHAQTMKDLGFDMQFNAQTPRPYFSTAPLSSGRIVLKSHNIWGTGVLGWLLVVVLFAPIWGGSLGICSVCWMLCTALYGSTSLQQSSKGSCSLLVSGYNLRADCQWRTLVPPLNSGANAAPASVLALM